MRSTTGGFSTSFCLGCQETIPGSQGGGIPWEHPLPLGSSKPMPTMVSGEEGDLPQAAPSGYSGATSQHQLLWPSRKSLDVFFGVFDPPNSACFLG